MAAPKRDGTASLPLAGARVTLAVMAVAALGFLGAALAGSGAEARRDAAMAQAVDYYRVHPKLEPSLALVVAAGDSLAEPVEESLGDAIAGDGDQAELDRLLAEADAAERELPAHQLGLAPGSASAQRAAVHALLHVSWPHLLWNLLLLAAAGPLLELRLGRVRYGALLAAGAVGGAALHLAASGAGAAPLVGFSAATAALAGALAVRPGDALPDPLAPKRSRASRSPIRAAAILGCVACAGLAAIGAGAPGFPPLALLGGFAAGAGGMFALARAGQAGDPPQAELAPEVAHALALLAAGDAAAALGALRARLAAADDPLAARALGLALRGRADAPEVMAQALLGAIARGQRASAIAAWRASTVLGAAPPTDSAPLRALAGWLRAEGSPGEARAAALAALAGADADTLAKLAREALRTDPVIALRAAERALAQSPPSETERKALQELAAQARKDAHNAGVVVLDAACEAARATPAKALRPSAPPLAAARAPAPGRDAADVADLAGDDGALDLEKLSAELDRGASLGTDDAPAAKPALEADDQNRAFFERGAIDLSAEEPAPPALPDPDVAGEAALLDALHAALAGDEELSAEAAHGAAESAPDAAALEAPAPRPLAAIAPAPEPSRAVRAPGVQLPPPPVLAPAAPSAADFAFGEPPDDVLEAEKPEPAQPALRPLQVSEATPQRFGSDALVVDIAGRGRAKLAYAKIDAVAAAGVKGISESGKPVLLIDLAIGHAKGAGELRVVRLRADGFDPRKLVEGHGSPLAALRAFVAALRARSRAAALPASDQANAPFRIYADLASYEREVLGAERS